MCGIGALRVALEGFSSSKISLRSPPYLFCNIPVIWLNSMLKLFDSMFYPHSPPPEFAFELRL